MKFPSEPFKITVVEPIGRTTCEKQKQFQSETEPMTV